MRYFLIAIIALISFSACKKEREGSPAATILGKWYLKKYRTRTFRNDLVVRDTSRLDFMENDFELFNGDGSGYTSNNTPAGETAIIEYNYTLTGERLIISRNTPAFYAGTYMVSVLTSDSLKVSYESSTFFSGYYFKGLDELVFSRK
ncbi:hypothetical protein ACFFGT_10290 [Mucilaginibacter angelicae]|uniref:Lipocalin-like domain-containing protein n=1 Tax=Mucilaginibacter angelicae TaxID=869718 RepID=A0ABV6L544_9SPHI